MSGVYDGGAGGFDSLVFDNGPHFSASYDPTGANSGTIVTDGQALSFAGLEPISLGAVSHVTVDTSATTGASQSPDPLAATLHGLTSGFTSTDASDNLVISGTDHNGQSFEYITFHADSAAAGLELTFGAGDTLQVLSLPNIGKNLTIDGASTVTFAGSFTESGALDVTASASGGQIITGSSAATQSISALGVNAGITVQSGVTLTASSISLDAQSHTTATITSPLHALFPDTSDLTSASITTGNSATIEIDGALHTTGAVSVLTSVTLDDTITAAGSDGDSLTSVTIGATDVSQITFGSAASISSGTVGVGAATVDIGATTNVNINITADHLADGVLARLVPIVSDLPGLDGDKVHIQTTVTNTTAVILPVNSAAMILQSGLGTVAGSDASVLLSAVDTTNVTTALTTSPTSYLPLVNSALVFSTVDSSVSLGRTTEVLVGDVTPDVLTSASIPASKIIQAQGDADLMAASDGSIQNVETSDSVGSTENTAGSSGSPGDVTVVELRGVRLDVAGLTASATSGTDYLASSHLVSNTIYGKTDALIDFANVTTGADGLSLSSQDNSIVMATAQSIDFDTNRIAGIDLFKITITEFQRRQYLQQGCDRENIEFDGRFRRYRYGRGAQQYQHRVVG